MTAHWTCKGAQRCALTLLLPLSLVASSAQAAQWTQVTLPAGIGTNMREIHASSDGYLYISGQAGTWRAQADAVAANPTNVVWTVLTNGLPTCNGASGCTESPYLTGSYFLEDRNGVLTA